MRRLVLVGLGWGCGLADHAWTDPGASGRQVIAPQVMVKSVLLNLLAHAG